jgi:dTDP-3-amino-3,4,6-trideoxy-alpha-D-glucose transaminase
VGAAEAGGSLRQAGRAQDNLIAGARRGQCLAVPLTRLDNADPARLDELLAAVERVARQGAFTLGAEVEAFEAEFAAYCESDFAVGVSSGTEALALCLRALDIGPGDEVIVPANSFIATAEAVTLVGAKPRLVDVDFETQLVTAERIEAAIGPRTRAVIPVHLFGRTVEMDPILELARARGLRVIEDAAQAHGARYRDRRVGSLGDCGAFSFYPSKNLGAWGDGGAVTTSDGALAERLRRLRAHGEAERYHHLEPGTTARLDAIQAAVLRVKLRRLDADNEARRQLARWLDAELGDLVTIPPPPGPDHDHVYHQYVIRIEDRAQFRNDLDAERVATGIHYPVPIHRSPAYGADGQVSLPNAEQLAETICSLPMYPSMTDNELQLLIAACRSFADRRAAHAA